MCVATRAALEHGATNATLMDAGGGGGGGAGDAGTAAKGLASPRPDGCGHAARPGGSGAGAGGSPRGGGKNSERKAAKKLAKQQARAKREGRAPPGAGSKACDLCGQGVDHLIRCQTDKDLAWRMVCLPCWPSVSGGVTDGDAAHPFYRYGGVWKNRTVHAAS